MIYPDTSAIVALFRTGPHSAQARFVLDQASSGQRMSDLTLAETSAALTAYHRGRPAGANDLSRLLAIVDIWFAARVPIVRVDTRDIAEATLLVRRLDLRLRVPDALHIAVCRRIGARLLTFDQDQCAAAAALGIALA